MADDDKVDEMCIMSLYYYCYMNLYFVRPSTSEVNLPYDCEINTKE